MEQPDKVLLYGDGGSGKTVSLATLVNCLKENGRLILLMTERNSASGISKGLEIHKIKPKPGQLVFVFPKKKEKTFGNLAASVKEFQNSSLRQARSGNSDSTEGREKFSYFGDLMNTLNNFIGTDLVTNEEVKVGSVYDLTANDILVVDGYTPIVSEVWNSVVGTRLLANMGDYIPVQRIVLEIIRGLHSLECGVVMLGHEKLTYKDVQDAKGQTISVPDKIIFNAGCGEANFSQIMGNFTDVIHSSTNGTRYVWDIRNPKVHTVLRNPNFPERDREVEPNFAKWGFFK